MRMVEMSYYMSWWVVAPNWATRLPTLPLLGTKLVAQFRGFQATLTQDLVQVAGK